jgi:hypothetical protein
MNRIALTLVGLCALAPFGMAQSKPTKDPLKPYTQCKVPGDLRITEVSRAKYDGKSRTVKTDNGMEKVSVVDGYRVMFSYKGLWYYYANVKIEQSDPGSYEHDRETIVSSLRHFATTKEATGIVYADKSELNGFEHYGIDRDQIDVGGHVGNHVLFDNQRHLVVSIYFLNQDDKAPGIFRAISGESGERRFHNLDEYQKLRDDFLADYSGCLRATANSQP